MPRSSRAGPIIWAGIADRAELIVTTSDFLRLRFNIDVRVQTEVLKISPRQHLVELTDHISGKSYIESYDKLLLATGSRGFVPPIPGLDSQGCFVLKTLADTDRIRAYYDEYKPDSIVVMGGGPIGMELLESRLPRLGSKWPWRIGRIWRQTC